MTPRWNLQFSNSSLALGCCAVQAFWLVVALMNLISMLPFLFPALSCQEVTDDEVLDASCLLDVLRMYRWQISSFEEQVNTTFRTGLPRDSFPLVSSLAGEGLPCENVQDGTVFWEGGKQILPTLAGGGCPVARTGVVLMPPWPPWASLKDAVPFDRMLTSYSTSLPRRWKMSGTASPGSHICLMCIPWR